MIGWLELLSYEDSLRGLGMFRMKKKKLWGDAIAPKEAYKKTGEGLFLRVCRN